MRERNVALGVFAGSAMACVYSFAAILIYAFRGPKVFAANNITLGQTVLLYWVGGLIGGGLVGALLPWSTSRVGSVVVGIIAALPFYLFTGLLIYGSPRFWDSATWIGMAGTAVLLGGTLGYLLWRPVDP